MVRTWTANYRFGRIPSRQADEEDGKVGREPPNPRLAREQGQDAKYQENGSDMFEPLHRDHSIETVILRLTGSGEMMEHERERLDEGYKKYWKAVLPAANQGQVMEIAMGPTPLVDERPKPLAPTQYVEFMRMGKAAWWMEITGPTILIGCAQYGGWESVSRKAYELFASLGKTLGNAHPLAHIRSAELTYQDLLVWNGTDDTYDPALAIRQERIPTRVVNSKVWHKGEGWVESPEGRRILERFQIEAELRGEEGQIHPIIQVVTTAIWGFGDTDVCLKLDKSFDKIQSVDGKDNDGRAVYDELHRRTHALFGNLITESIASRIGLSQAGDRP